MFADWPEHMYIFTDLLTQKLLVAWNGLKFIIPTIIMTNNLHKKAGVKNDKRFFGVYRSAVSHTHNFKLPKIVLLIPLSLIAIAFSVYSIYSMFDKDDIQKVNTLTKAVPILKGVAQNGAASSRVLAPSPYDLPIYSALRKPNQYPELSCYKTVVTSSFFNCTCYTQQSTIYKLDKNICLDFVDNGFFDHALVLPSDTKHKNNENLESGGVF